jgi:hypothetical protein
MKKLGERKSHDQTQVAQKKERNNPTNKALHSVSLIKKKHRRTPPFEFTCCIGQTQRAYH